MKIAICDDDLACREQIAEAVSIYASEHQDTNVSFSIFEHSEDLIEAVEKQGDFDTYILDVVMPDINGIDLGKRLRNLGCVGRIIYLTSSTEYAVDSYKVKAFNYLLKPVKYEELFTTLDEIANTISANSEKSTIIKTKNGKVKLILDTIMYAELCRRIVVFHLINGNTVESTTIRTPFAEAVNELITDSRFSLGNKSLVVNLEHITMVENECLVFKNSYRTYPGVKTCREIRSVWSDYWINKED